ncbi:MAG TPA: phospholipase D family protein [Rhizobacter sp.]|nr:phospholipase D family protein [Rhizobacter sp.]
MNLLERCGQRASRAAALVALAIGLSACGTLPPLENRSVTGALHNTAETQLGRAVAREAGAHPGLSGIYPLRDARDAFAARVLLARTAERSLDVQYYIWHNDLSGKLLFASLREAADRGVRVRLLLDDNNTSGLDPTLAALDAHPNIEVRLFNPFVIRASRLWGYLTDFSRLNRRMHNKSFTADNQITIMGGRNVGDEYFGANDDVGFVDLDVIAAGPVVPQVSQQFDVYWASESAYPLDSLVGRADAAAVAEYQAAAAALVQDPAALVYADAVRQSPLAQMLQQGRPMLEWAGTHLVSDDPGKALDKASAETLLVSQLRAILGEPAKEVALVSPYFVPTQLGVDAFVRLARRGVKVRILTNSLEANDVTPVHAGYAKWRKALLQAGVQLYELRHVSGLVGKDDKDKGSGERGRLGSSSGASLHAKTFAVDGERAFVGSFNFDPRSKSLNTELGVIIDSPLLAQDLGRAFDTRIPLAAYEVKLSDDGEDLVWLERLGTETRQHTSEPGSGVLKRGWVKLLSIMPIDWML